MNGSKLFGSGRGIISQFWKGTVPFSLRENRDSPQPGFRPVLRWALPAALCWGVVSVGTASAQPPSVPAVAEGLQEALVRAIAAAERSVVAIARVRRDQPGEAFVPEFRPDPVGRRTVPSTPAEPTDPGFIPTEFATGVVVDRGGLILTAGHVLGDQSDYYVTTHERKVYRAWIKGSDPRSDLAVLAIDAANLEPIPFGDAGQLKKGQMVIALGNPYAIARDGQVSASWGIVSNLARKAPPAVEESEFSRKSTLHHFGTLIQTDAKLNLGTSGGPLLNLQGEMVGLTTSLAAVAGYEQAAGYAIPVDATFRRVIETLKQGREVEYGYLGIQPTNLFVRETLEGLSGARVHAVLPGTPAQRYGLRSGDIVSSVNDRAIHDADGLVLEVGRLPVESVVRLGILRDGSKIRLDVRLAKFPVRGNKIVTTPAPSWRGLRIDYLTAVLDPAGSELFDVPALAGAVVVTDVQEGTPAWEAGVRPSDMISHVERALVRSPKEFRAAVAGKTGPVRLTFFDEGESSTRTIAPES